MSLVLVTGGAGYIGTHTCVELMAAGHEVVVVDNFSNSKPEALRRVVEITGHELAGKHCADVRDRAALSEIFGRYPIDAVIHFAALKAVGESVRVPLAYYDNNIAGTVALADIMGQKGVKALVFSSSATVYGDPASVPIRELSDFADQPIRADEVDDGVRAAGRGCGRSGVANCVASILQPGWRASERPNRRGPERNTEQSAALCQPSGRGAVG